MDVGELGLLEIARDIIAVGVDQRHHRLAGGCISARAQREIGDDTVDGRADGRSFKIDTREVAVGERLRITRERFFGLRTSFVALLASSEEHTSELQSLMRIASDVVYLTKKKTSK